MSSDNEVVRGYDLGWYEVAQLRWLTTLGIEHPVVGRDDESGRKRWRCPECGSPHWKLAEYRLHVLFCHVDEERALKIASVG